MSAVRVAVVQHFLSHYREPIFNLLSRQVPPNPEYDFFAGTSGKDQIRTIDYTRSRQRPMEGGLRWKSIHNIWIGKIVLWQIGVLKLALTRKYDTIVFLGSMYHLSTWVGAFLARLSGKRVLMWTHGYLREERSAKGLIRERFYRLAHGLLLYGDRARELLIKRGFEPDTLYVVYNSLDYDGQQRVFELTNVKMLDDLKRKLFTSPELPALVFVGRLTESKKLYLLLEAVHLLMEEDFPLNVVLVGDGPESKSLQDQAQKLGIEDQVTFLGALYREEDLGPLFMLADLCVAPGEVGLTCIHALAYGTPVVTHGNPDHQMPEWEAIQPGINGSYFREGNAKDLAVTIRQWLCGGCAREQLSMNCKSIIESRYNPANQVRIINMAVSGMPATER
ncbi:MAG: glycosyltransferase [Candidatus Geothermincolia bacterium]